MPINPEKLNASRMERTDKTVGQPLTEERTTDVDTPTIIPMVPPIRDSVSDSR